MEAIKREHRQKGKVSHLENSSHLYELGGENNAPGCSQKIKRCKIAYQTDLRTGYYINRKLIIYQ